MRPALAPMLLALLALGLLAVDYLVAFGTAIGLEVDELAIPAGLAGPRLDRVEAATDDLLGTISIASLAIAGALVVALALLRRRPGQALVAGIVVAGANLTTQVLKPLLARLDPLGGDAERFSQGVFPSGHATVAMSLALALVIVVPARLRPVAAVAVGAYAAAIGVGLVLLGWHFPSDVAAGFLVATAWAAAALAWLRANAGHEATTHVPATKLRAGVVAALALAAVVGLAAAVAVGVRVADLGTIAQYGRLQTAFFASAVVIVVLGLLLPGAVAALMLRRRGAERVRQPAARAL